MQDKQFDELIKGNPAKWAENFNPIPFESVKEQNKRIEAEEVPIPEETMNAIHKFVKEQRRKKVRERTIRRLVQKKWNIHVSGKDKKVTI